MAFFKAIKRRFIEPNDSGQSDDPRENRYYEAICARVPALVDRDETVIEFRWIKNSEAQIKGAQAVFMHRGEQVPIVVSAPSHESFSMGINIGLSKVLYPPLREELERLRSEGGVTPEALVSYNGSTGQAILYRRTKTVFAKGDIEKWRSTLASNTQLLINDFEALLPFIMRFFGE